jgi:hypothetical protein
VRFMILHRTNAHWESGANPGLDLIARVGKMIGKMAAAGALRAAEGLRPSSEGVRVRFRGGKRTATKGPFPESNEVPARFAIFQVESMEQAIDWASRFASLMGDVEIDIRPVTEPRDLGMSPKPAQLKTRRFMAMHKASETTVGPTREQSAEIRRVIEEATKAGVLLTAEGFQPSSRIARFKGSGGKQNMIDGPFTESKELIAGYVIVEARSLEEAMEWAPPYAAAVGSPELDVRPLADALVEA